jgi:hypothetical protein
MNISKLLTYKKAPSPVPIPELEETYYIRTMSGTERDAFEDETYKINGKSIELNRQNARARLVVKCLCDENGTRALQDNQVNELGQVPADILDKLYSVALNANGFTAKDVEDITKNS